MSEKLNLAALQDLLQKTAYAPPGPPPGQPPMDPAMMGAMPPMDPAMMGAMPPMDPAMMGAIPPGGMPPMDPAMMGAMPPAGGVPSAEDLMAAYQASGMPPLDPAAGGMTPVGPDPNAIGNVGAKDGETAPKLVSELTVDELVELIGSGAKSKKDKPVSDSRFEEMQMQIDALTEQVALLQANLGMVAPEGVPTMPSEELSAPPMPEAMPESFAPPPVEKLAQQKKINNSELGTIIQRLYNLR